MEVAGGQMANESQWKQNEQTIRIRNTITSLTISDEEESAFNFVTSNGDERKINVNFRRNEDKSYWKSLFKSAIFQKWVKKLNYDYVNQLFICELNLNEDDTIILSCRLEHSTTVEDEEVLHPGTVLLSNEEKATVLILLKRFDEGKGSREFVLFCNSRLRGLIDDQYLELFNGSIDSNGKFVCDTDGSLSKVFSDGIDSRDMTAIKEKDHLMLSCGTYDMTQLYVYQKAITTEEYENIKSYCTGAASPLSLIPLSGAYKACDDMRALVALMFIFEYRYHQIPLRRNFRPPTRTEQNMRKPTYVEITELDPNHSGANLKVKVLEITNGSLVEPKRREAHKDNYIRVGDASGVINMKLDAAQAKLPGILEKGSCWYIQNANLSVTNNKLLMTITKWGKINPPNDEDMADFNFEVNVQNDKSSVEYELVELDIYPEVRNVNLQTNGSTQRRITDRGRGRGRGTRGRVRGRGGM